MTDQDFWDECFLVMLRTDRATIDQCKNVADASLRERQQRQQSDNSIPKIGKAISSHHEKTSPGCWCAACVVAAVEREMAR